MEPSITLMMMMMTMTMTTTMLTMTMITMMSKVTAYNVVLWWLTIFHVVKEIHRGTR
jgi:hypothetical protein